MMYPLTDLFALLVRKSLKVVANVYDAVTLPLYNVLQMRCKKAVATPTTQQLEPGNPYSPWVRVGDVPKYFAHECQTLAQLMEMSMQINGDRKCLGLRVSANYYRWLTYRQINGRINKIMYGLIANHVKPKSRVCIFSETRMEWMLCAQALVRMGAVVATLYSTFGEENIVNAINETESSHVVTSQSLLPTIQRIQQKLPRVKCIIYFDTYHTNSKQTVDTIARLWGSLSVIPFTLLEKQEPAAQQPPIPPKPDDLAFILYTSGSTGRPKGVMINQRNFVSVCQSYYSILAESLSKSNQQKIFINYLPLGHSYELGVEILLISLGIGIGYSTPATLTDFASGLKKGSQGDASVLEPTGMTTVPLILTRLKQAILEEVRLRGTFYQEVFKFSIEYKARWTSRGYDTPIINSLICGQWREKVSRRLETVFCAGASLDAETHSFIQAALNVKLRNWYGMTETSGPASIMDQSDLSLGRVGLPLPGEQLRLVEWAEGGYSPKDKPNPRGEVVIGGEFVSTGYLDMDETTREVFKEENGIKWFFTGDIGEVYPDGTLNIIDRKNDIVKLQSGKYVSLAKVEAVLRKWPLVESTCVHGDQFREFVVALIVPNVKALRTFAASLGIKACLYDLFDDKDLNLNVLQEIHLIGSKAGLLPSELPLKVKLCREGWSPEFGLTTGSFKIRRKVIREFYRKEIDAMYAGDEQADENNNRQIAR